MKKLDIYTERIHNILQEYKFSVLKWDFTETKFKIIAWRVQKTIGNMRGCAKESKYDFVCEKTPKTLAIINNYNNRLKNHHKKAWSNSC